MGSGHFSIGHGEVFHKQYDIGLHKREQSVTTSSGTRSASTVVTSTSPLAASSTSLGYRNVTRISSSTSVVSTWTETRPTSSTTTYIHTTPRINPANQIVRLDYNIPRPVPPTQNRPDLVQGLQSSYMTNSSSSHLPSTHMVQTSLTRPQGISRDNSTLNPLPSTRLVQRSSNPSPPKPSAITTPPQDLIKQLLIRNLRTSQLLSNRLKQEQESRENSPEQQEKLQTLHQQQLKVKQNFQTLTLKLKEYQSTKPTPVSSPRIGDVCERPARGELSVVNTERVGVSGSSPMTFIEQQASQRPEESETKMDSRYFPSDDLSPHLNLCDFPLSSDVIEGSIYASSPNSLYMYEQEKMDMQSTIPSISGTSSFVDTCSGFQDDFELNSKYETSQDLSNSVSVTPSCRPDHTISSALIYNKGGGVWENPSTKQTDAILIKNENESDANPTLAELNLDLLDDIQNVIDVDMNLLPNPSVQFDTTSDVKLENVCQSDKEQTYKAQNTAGTSVPGSTTTETFAHVKIKEEPVDYPLYHNMQNVKSYTPMYIKSETSQTKTLKEVELSHSDSQGTSIDISDTSTLQQLLHGRPLASLVRPPRTRSISENMHVRPRPSAVAPSRKRGSTSAGLESMDKKWEEIKQFIHMETRDDLSMYAPTHVKRERKRYDSASSAMTLTSNEDEDSDSDRDDLDEDSDSDFEGGTDLGMLNPEESLVGNTKEKQFFWQYNVQSKGPKGTRVHFEMEDDPHVLNDFEDPVFDPAHSNSAGVGITIKHGGKARKGDGNDIVPNPKRLCQIGLQLRKINKQINDFIPVNELPSLARSKTRKEKNKLASRACRLKKKAQHEAHKIKLNGLETEHLQLLTVILKMRKILVERLHKREHLDKSMADKLNQLITDQLRTMIGGNTADYVNRVVQAVENGDMTGGVNLHTRRSYPKELHN